MKNEKIIDNLCQLISAIEEFKKYYTEAPNDLKINDEILESLKEAADIIERLEKITIEKEFETKEVLDESDKITKQLLDLLVGKIGLREDIDYMVRDVDVNGNIKTKMSITILRSDK